LKDRWCSSTLCAGSHLAALHLGADSKDEKPQNSEQSGTYNVDEESAATDARRANATFIFLARNSELKAVVQSIQSMEDRFNKRFKYPYVFLNDEPFSDEFKE
jgi:alpha 1,2-mannosyltransferase